MYFDVFQGENIKRFYHFIQPTYFIYEDTPDTLLIHIESNDIAHSKQHDLDVKYRVQRIIDIGLYCWECSVKDRNFHLIRIIRQTNDSWSKYYVLNNFHYLTTGYIYRQNLKKDGIHLTLIT